MRPNSTVNSPLVVLTDDYKTNIVSPLSSTYRRNVVGSGFESQVTGHRPYAMVREGDLVYSAGSRIVGGLHHLHSIVYDLSTDRILLTRSYESHSSLQFYWGINLFGDFLYLSGMVVDGGVLKAICRKVSKTLTTQWTRIWTVGSEPSYSTTAILSGDKVYTGSWVDYFGGTALCLNDADGSIVWSRTAQELFGEVFDAGDNVDFFGTSGGVRFVSRRAKSDGSQIASFISGNYWWYKGIHYGGHYFVGSRFLHGGVEKASLTRITPISGIVWDAVYDFVPPGDQELFYNCCTDGDALYVIGRAWDASAYNYRAIFAKISFAGSVIWARMHTENCTANNGIFVDANYLYVGTIYNVVPSGCLEIRSKTNGDLIYARFL